MKTMNFTFDSETETILRTAAALRGMKMSAYIRQLIRKDGVSVVRNELKRRGVNEEERE